MSAVSDDQQAAKEASAPLARAATEGVLETSANSPATGVAGGPANLLALQRKIGNRSVARLVKASEGQHAAGTGLTSRALLSNATQAGLAADRVRATSVDTPHLPAARLTTASEQVVQRSFFGKLWSGIKSAASSAWSGIKGAASAVAGAVESVASSIWDGAKKLGNWAVDWLKSAGSAVWDALKWFGTGAWDVIKVIGTWAWEKLSLLGSLAWDFVSFLPARLWRVVIDGWDAISGVLSWLWKGISGGASWAWVWDGFKRGLSWCLQTLIQLLELVGIADALQFVWGLIFHTRPLTDPERAASESVHGPGLIPYGEVRVDQDSFMVKIGAWINRLFDPTAGPRAITTMHIIQAPANLELDVAVHELTHVAQYQKIGAVYMPQALHAQKTEMGYNYGDLAAARADGKHFADFNREQQAQICQDYYLVKNNLPPWYHATEAQLEPFIQDMRSGAF